jgi:hypothetical protein
MSFEVLSCSLESLSQEKPKYLQMTYAHCLMTNDIFPLISPLTHSLTRGYFLEACLAHFLSAKNVASS